MTKSTTEDVVEEGAVVPGAPDDLNLPPDTDHADPEPGPDAVAEAEAAEAEATDAEDLPDPPKPSKADLADLETYFGQLGAQLFDALSTSIVTGGGPIHISVAHLGTGMTLNVRVSPEF